jgi:hypothetical protein
MLDHRACELPVPHQEILDPRTAKKAAKREQKEKAKEAKRAGY